MIRTEETEALRYRISIIKDKIELKEQGFFEQGTTIAQLKAALEEAERELQSLQINISEKNSSGNFDLSEP